MGHDFTNEHWAFVSTEPAGRRETRYALVALLVSTLIFLVAVPFAKMPLAQVSTFIPIYVTSLVICDLITAALLFGQFSVLRSVPLLILAGGYFFTASITFAYALIFPGLFMLPGVPIAGPQTSSAMYMFWHSGFPLVIIAYVRSGATGRDVSSRFLKANGSVRFAISAMIGGVLAIVSGFTLFATWGHEFIPVFLNGNYTTTLGRVVLSIIWSLSLIALIVLWRRRPRTVLDMWLIGVMCVWLFDIALAAILNGGRYDLGWYAGRIYGLLAASFLLVLLLLENGRQYARLVRMSVELSEANRTLAQLTRQDGMTELANRRYFDEYLPQQIALANRRRRPLALVLCDVDSFKAYNDHYGHPAGDECLKQVALALRASCQRAGDMPARYGGEEFAMILPDTDSKEAAEVAETARTALLRMGIPHARSPAGSHLSMSCGVATVQVDHCMSAHELIEIADQALYRAKSLGRNRVVCAPTRPKRASPEAGRPTAR